MDIKRIVLGFFAAAAVLVGCEPKEEDFGVAKIEVSTSQLTFTPSSGSQTLQVTASREWTVSGLPEWIAVDPAGGAPSKSPQNVTVTVIPNDGYDREADITFTIGLMKEYVKVSQNGQKGQFDAGDGSKERPYSASAAVDYVGSLPADTESGPVYVRGIISAVTTTYEASGNYGNATFDISDDGSTTAPQFKVFQTYYLGNKKWTAGNDDVKVGDEVIVYGKVVNYKGNTPETVGKGASYVYSHNGKTAGDTPTPPAGDPKGTGVKDDPFNVAAALDAVKDLTWTSKDVYDKVGPYYVKGKIASITEEYGTQFGNATFTISDDGTASNEFTVYRALYLGNKKFASGNTQIKVGDEVVIYGELMNYHGDTPETVQNSAYLYSLNGDTGTVDPPQPPAGDPKGTGTQADPYNPAGAANAVKDLTWTDNTTYDATSEVYVKGKISRIANKGTFTEGGTYGNASFYISEDGSQAGEFYCFRVLYLGNKKFESGQTDIKVGDEVIVYGQLMNYHNDTPETVAGKAYLYSLNGDTGSDTPPTPPAGETDHGATTVANFLAASESTTDWYELTGTISNLKDGDKFGNFDLTDNSGSVYVYGVLSTKGGEKQKFQELVSQYGIANGGTITIKANRGSYQDKIEAVNAYFISYSGGDTPPTPPSGDPKGTGTLDDPYNPLGAANAVKDFTWTDNNTYDATGNVYVKGKISRIANKGTFTEGGTYGNASFYISEDGSQSGEFYCFRVLYLGNKKFESGQTDIKVGDEVVIYGQLMNYQGKTPETVSGKAYLYSLNGKTEDDGSGQGGGGGEVSGAFTSNVTWTAESSDSSYDQKANVNGTNDVSILKLGTGSKYGSSTLTLPGGSTSLSFYAIAWNGAAADLIFKVGGKEVKKISPAPNSGLKGNPTYTITVSDSDYYTISFDSATTTVTVETSGGYRAALFGIQAK
ncbi:MAG: hypothetical protein IKX07_05380 [Bacteroidales bacterium]|nr:hypothetical protein [Bacteroidales bacterium]